MNILFITPSEAKSKTVLLVSRMEERQKRIKLAMRIWDKTPHDGWQLKIVGNGVDLDYYKRLVHEWKIQDISFEGHTFFAPNDYDAYLKNLYGDYMQIPPEDKRVTHLAEITFLDEKK